MYDVSVLYQCWCQFLVLINCVILSLSVSFRMQNDFEFPLVQFVGEGFKMVEVVVSFAHFVMGRRHIVG